MKTGTIAVIRRWKTAQTAAGRPPGTIRQREGTLRRFARDARVDPLEATREQIEAWLARPRGDGKPLAPNSRRTYYNDLDSFFSWCEDVEILDRSPMRKVPRPAPAKLRPKPVTTRQLDTLIAEADARTRAMLILAAYAGLRCHEVAKVRGDDFDMENNRMLVLGKGGKEVWQPLHEAVIELVATMPERGYWFPGGGGRVHETPQSISRKVAALMRRHGIPKGAIHRMRHWFGTTAYRQTKDLIATQQLLRHESSATTQIYVELDEASLRTALDKLPRPRAS